MGSDERMFGWQDGGHEPFDFEDLPPAIATVASRVASSGVSQVLALLDYYGFTYTEEPGWMTRNPTYLWADGAPFGVMVHHTVSVPYPAKSAYPAPEGNRTDGRTICNFLVQPDGVINCISADPANYSSGEGQEPLITDYVELDRRFAGPQSGPYDKGFYGNRYFVNIETVASGDGGPIPQVQEDAVIGLCAALCYVAGWSAWRCVAHADWRGTKIDPRWTAEYGKAPYSIAGLQDKINDILVAGLPPLPEDTDMWNAWVVGLVTGWAEDPIKTEDEFVRLKAEGKLGGDITYWVGLLDDPESPEWRGMVARTWLSSW